MLRQILRWTTLLAGLLLLVPGCGDRIPREAISGTVTLDGTPLAEGSITLLPVGSGPSAGGNIVDGRFQIARSDGPAPGKYRVEIVAYRGTGQMEPDPDFPDQMVERTEQIIPPRYNRDSELEIEVTAGGENRFPLELESQP